MLVSSFDTKYSQTATKYEYLDNNFTNLLSKDRRFSRIFTSVIENRKLDLSSDIVLRSDMTGQVINTILTHDFKSEHFLYFGLYRFFLVGLQIGKPCIRLYCLLLDLFFVFCDFLF